MTLVGQGKATVAFRRDKKSKDTPMIEKFANAADFWRHGEEFNYLLRPDGWVYRKGGTRNIKLTHAAINRES